MRYEGDLISTSFSWVIEWVDRLPMGVFLLFPRVALLLLAGLLVQEFAFKHESRSAFMQIGAFFLGAFLSLFIPLELFYRVSGAAKLVILMVSLLGLYLLPLAIAPMTFPEPGRQRRVLKVLYSSIILLTFLNVIVAS